MKRSVVETILGAVVLLVAGGFLAFSYKTSNVADIEGYTVTANFSGIGGLKAGDSVQISGVKVGQVVAVDLDPQSYQARVTASVASNIQLPDDTAAVISSESLLGGRYLSLEPGAGEEMISPGGQIQYTQAPQNLEQLLGKFIFSVQESKKTDSDKAPEATSDASAATP